METQKLKGRVLFGNIKIPKSFSASAEKFIEDANGVYQLTLSVDEKDKDYVTFAKAIEAKKKELMAGDKYKDLIAKGKEVKFSVKDKPHTDKEGFEVAGKRQISMKRNAVNAKGQRAKIQTYDKFGHEYDMQNDISSGSIVQAIVTIGDAYIASSQTWYLTMYLFAVLVESESQSSWDFDVAKPSIPEGELFEGATPFEGETPPPYEPSEVPF